MADNANPGPARPGPRLRPWGPQRSDTRETVQAGLLEILLQHTQDPAFAEVVALSAPFTGRTIMQISPEMLALYFFHHGFGYHEAWTLSFEVMSRRRRQLWLEDVLIEHFNCRFIVENGLLQPRVPRVQVQAQVPDAVWQRMDEIAEDQEENMRFVIKLLMGMGVVGILVIIAAVCYLFGQVGRIACGVVLLLLIGALLFF